jgi:protease-4
MLLREKRMTGRRWLKVAVFTVLLFGLLAAPVPAAERPVATLAHIRLAGELDETPVGADPLFGLGAENFKTKLERIKKARDDASIQGLYLEIDDLEIGYGKLDELRHAVAEFRAKGKKTYAYLEAGGGKDYLLAIACDEVFMPESGTLMLTGVRASVMFYKDLFEKIGVKADMLQMGEFKGAAEPFTRSEMSPQLRKQLTSVFADYYEKSYVGAIVESRAGKKWSADDVKKLVDQGPYTAKSALKAGLIDHVAYTDQILEQLKTEQKADHVKLSRNYGQKKMEELDLSNPFAILKLLAPPPVKTSKNPKIAVIYATGPIVTGKGGESLFGGSRVGSTTMVHAIRQAEHDKTVKAIVLRVDSPGGSALASDLIWNELKRSKKPVIASMSDVAASGGYYISMGAGKIYAEPGTLTGSIGVLGGKLVIGGLEDKIGLKTDTISFGQNADIMSTSKPFSESERKAMTALMQDVYDQFLSKALEGRKKAGKQMTLEDLKKLAAGRVWTGRQAKENGLIDELGTLEDAIAEAKEMGGIGKDKEAELLILPKPKSFLDALLESRSDPDSESKAPGMRLAPLLHGLPELAGPFRSAEALLQLRGEPVWVVLPYRIDMR